MVLEPVEVIADGHSKGQQLFQCLLRLVKGYGDPAGLKPDARGEAIELLIDNPNWRLYEKLRPLQPVLLQLDADGL